MAEDSYYIAQARENTVYANVNGSVQCWGQNAYNPIGDNSGASSIPMQAVGLTSGVYSGPGTLAMFTMDGYAIQNGAGYGWGRNDTTNPHIGNGTAVGSAVPTPVSELSSGVTWISGEGAVMNGGAYCWGSNSTGTVGYGTTTTRFTPVPVVGLSSGVTQVADSESSICALANGGVWCWGIDIGGSLGDGPAIRFEYSRTLCGRREAP